MTKLANLVRFGQFLYHQRVKGFEVSSEPHLDPETLAYFRNALAGQKSYMEFGSGGSTVLAAELGVPTISVDSDRFFAAAVRAKIPARSEVNLIDANIGVTTAWGVPLPSRPNLSRVRRWRRYIDLPFEALANSARPFPGLVLIDGRFRRACALRTAREATGAAAHCTLLFDDYFREERTSYREVEAYLGSPRRIGRSAIFEIAPDLTIRETAIDEAMQDYR